MVLKLDPFRYFLNRKSRLEKKDADRFHHLDSIDLVAKERLFSPHSPHEYFFIFKQERDDPHQDMNRSFKYLPFIVISNCLNLSPNVMHKPHTL